MDGEHVKQDLALEIWKQIHAKPNEPAFEILFDVLTRPIYQIVYEGMDESLIMKAAVLKKVGGFGQSGFDVDGWRKFLLLHSFQ